MPTLKKRVAESNEGVQPKTGSANRWDWPWMACPSSGIPRTTPKPSSCARRTHTINKRGE